MMANDIVTLRASSSQLKFGRTSARALVPHASGAHLGESDLLLAGEGGPKAVPSGADKRSQECRRAWVSLGRGPVRKFCRPIGTWLHLHHGGVRLKDYEPVPYAGRDPCDGDTRAHLQTAKNLAVRAKSEQFSARTTRPSGSAQ
jgi:hypothetical protein